MKYPKSKPKGEEKMKKLLSVVLALTMVLTLGVTAFAEDATWNGSEYSGNNSLDVTASYSVGSTVDASTVHYVTIDWEIKGTAAYSEGTTTYTWNTTGDNALKYTSSTTDAGWTITPAEVGGAEEITVKVTVTNYSNAAVTASVAYEDKNGVTANCSTAGTVSKELGSAAEGATLDGSETGTATSNEVTYTISGLTGVPTVGEGANSVVIGTITVTLTTPTT